MDFWKPSQEIETIAKQDQAKPYRFNSCLYHVRVGNNIYYNLDYYRQGQKKAMALDAYFKYFVPAMKKWGGWEFVAGEEKELLDAYFKRGGLCSCLTTETIYKGKIVCVDVNALYAFIISGLMPYGKRLYTRPSNGTYITFILVKIKHAKARTKIKLWPNPDNLINTGRQANRLDEVWDQDIGFTQQEFDELKKWYTISYKVLQVWYYRTGNIFTRVSEAFEKERLLGDKNAKALRNSAMGCFGMRNGGLCYLPVYVALTSLARTYLMRLIWKQRDTWLYSDTDSLILQNPNLDAFGKGFINNFMGGGKIEAIGDTFALLQPKNYIIYKRGKPIKEALSIIRGETYRDKVKKLSPKNFIKLKSFKVNDSWEVLEHTPKVKLNTVVLTWAKER